MTTVTFDSKVNLPKTHFRDPYEFMSVFFANGRSKNTVTRKISNKKTSFVSKFGNSVSKIDDKNDIFLEYINEKHVR